MRLDGRQFAEVQNSLLSGFTDYDQLMRFARFDLDVRLPEIAGRQDLSSCVFALVDWAESNGRLDDLVNGAGRRVPGNEDIQMLQQRYPDWKKQAQFWPATGTANQQRQWFAAQIGVPLPARIQAEQYDLYKHLWISLQALKKQGDELWQEASPANLLRFSDQLTQTIKVVDENALLFEDKDYRALQDLLSRLGDYWAGKQRIIDIRSRKDYQRSFAQNLYENAHAQIELNRLLKVEYERVLEEVRSSFHKTLCGQV